MSEAVGLCFLPEVDPDLPRMALSYRSQSSTFWTSQRMKWMIGGMIGWSSSTGGCCPATRPRRCSRNAGFRDRRAVAGVRCPEARSDELGFAFSLWGGDVLCLLLGVEEIGGEWTGWEGS